MLALAYVYFNYIKSHMNVWATCAPSTADRTRRGTLERSTTLPNKRISIKLLTFCSRMIFNCSVCQQRNRSSGRTGVSPKIKTKQMHLNRSIWTLLSLLLFFVFLTFLFDIYCISSAERAHTFGTRFHCLSHRHGASLVACRYVWLSSVVHRNSSVIDCNRF